VLFEAGLAFALFPNSTVVAQVGRLRPMSDLAGVHFVPLDESPQSRESLARRLQLAGCRPRVPANGAPSIDIPTAATSLPPATIPAGFSAMVLRALRSVLPIPAMGDHVEVAREVRIGERVTLSVRMPDVDTGMNLAVLHWSPGSPQPERLSVAGRRQTPRRFELDIDVRGPAGIHVFDFIDARSMGASAALARTQCAVGER
jgi:hypothetical protein